jgi:hypothetical protein
MPFDGAGLVFDERVSKLDEVIDLVASPDKWCKGVLRTYDGRYCIRGAIIAVKGECCLAPIVLRSIRGVTRKHYLSIEAFNDHYDTDHARVLTVLVHARDVLVSGELDPGSSKTFALAHWRASLWALLAGPSVANLARSSASIANSGQ